MAERLKSRGFDFPAQPDRHGLGRRGFGVVYHLEATSTGGECRAADADLVARNAQMLPSVCDLWKTAGTSAVFDFSVRFPEPSRHAPPLSARDWLRIPLPQGITIRRRIASTMSNEV